MFNKISFIYHHIYFENSNRLRDYFNVYVQMKELVKKLMALIVKLKVSLQILFSPVTSNGNAMENFLDHHGGMKIKLAQN